VDPPAVLRSLDADERLEVGLAHVAELVLVPRIPETKNILGFAVALLCVAK
jgi:hypothetical protein